MSTFDFYDSFDLLNKTQNVQECDARKAEQKYKAGNNIKNKN